MRFSKLRKLIEEDIKTKKDKKKKKTVSKYNGKTSKNKKKTVSKKIKRERMENRKTKSEIYKLNHEIESLLQEINNI